MRTSDIVPRTVAGRKVSLPVIARIVRMESSYPQVMLSPPGVTVLCDSGLKYLQDDLYAPA